LAFLGGFLTLVLSTFSQAVVLYGAFQDMRGKRVSLGESLKVGLSRLPAIIGLAGSTTGSLAAKSAALPWPPKGIG